MTGLLFCRITGSDDKLIYRHYATLYFVFCVDSSESELGILDLIQVSLPCLHFPCEQILGLLVNGSNFVFPKPESSVNARL